MSNLSHVLQTVYLLAIKDLKQQTKGSALGWFWLVLEPAAMLVIYTFVFGFLLKVRFESGTGTDSFALYLMVALIPFSAFRDAAERSTTSLSNNRDLIQRVVFPPVLLPLVICVTSLFVELIGLVLVGVAVLVMGVELTYWILLLPLLILTRLAITLGLGWMLSVVNVFFKDLSHIIGILLTVLFFSTPIIYPVSMVPDEWSWVFAYNPIYYLISAYRAIFLHGVSPEPGFFIISVASLLFMWLGYAMFVKTLDRARDLL